MLPRNLQGDSEGGRGNFKPLDEDNSHTEMGINKKNEVSRQSIMEMLNKRFLKSLRFWDYSFSNKEKKIIEKWLGNSLRVTMSKKEARMRYFQVTNMIPV